MEADPMIYFALSPLIRSRKEGVVYRISWLESNQEVSVDIRHMSPFLCDIIHHLFCCFPFLLFLLQPLSSGGSSFMVGEKAMEAGPSKKPCFKSFDSF